MAVIDGMNINGTGYDIRDKVAVRFNDAQNLTDAQKAQGRTNIGAVALNQGVAQAGKALVVGEDGNVTTGDAVQIDATLAEAGQAADAAAVGTALDGKLAIQQGSENAGKALVVGTDGNVVANFAGISNAVKFALLSLLQHVAYIDDQCQMYYNLLYAALYGGGLYPQISVIYAPGNHVVYTDDNLDTLKDYLTVTYYETEHSTGEVLQDSDYTLSGVLTDGVCNVIVGYNNTFSVVQVEAVDVYDHWNWAFPGPVIKLVANLSVINTYNHIVINYNASASAKRRGFVAEKGISPYVITQDGTPTIYYPIPVPSEANKLTMRVLPETMQAYCYLVQYANGVYTQVATTDSYANVKSLEFEKGDGLFIVPLVRNQGNAQFVTEPESFTVTFEEV